MEDLEELIERIFSYLKEFQNDRNFLSIKEKLLKIIDNASLDSIKIFLGPSFSIDEVLATSEAVKIVTHMKSMKDFDVDISIEDEEYTYDFYAVSGEVSLSGHYIEDNSILYYGEFSYTIKDSRRKLVQKEEIIDDNDFFHDYKLDIRYFDSNGKYIKEDTESLKDKMFSAEFHIPLNEARSFRLNFPKFKHYINECRERGNSEDLDNSAASKIFSTPFDINYFETFFISDKTPEEYEEMPFPFNYKPEEIEEANLRIQTIKEALRRNIGSEGEIVISSNILGNILSYAYNSSCGILITSGIIIKKLNGRFIKFWINFSQEGITSIPEEISKEEAQNLYYDNTVNESVLGLAAFFGIERNRR